MDNKMNGPLGFLVFCLDLDRRGKGGCGLRADRSGQSCLYMHDPQRVELTNRNRINYAQIIRKFTYFPPGDTTPPTSKNHREILRKNLYFFQNEIFFGSKWENICLHFDGNKLILTKIKVFFLQNFPMIFTSAEEHTPNLAHYSGRI